MNIASLKTSPRPIHISIIKPSNSNGQPHSAQKRLKKHTNYSVWRILRLIKEILLLVAL